MRRWPARAEDRGAGARRLAALAAAALLLCAAPAGTALPPAAAAEPDRALREKLLPGIKGEDQRRILDSDAAPWRAIGRVNRRTGGYCTGTMIAPGRVLTAAHCLWNRRTGRWLPPQALHFVGGYRRGAWVADAAVARIELPPEAQGGPDGAGFRPALDWAVLVLAAPLPELGTIPLAAGDAESGDSLVQVGYSQDKPHILTAHTGCHRLADAAAGGMVVHDCDATYGDSGSPLLLRDAAGGYRLAALHVATARGPGGTAGLAIPAASIRPPP